MQSTRLPKYETDSLTDLLIDYVRNRVSTATDQPFFAALSVQPPHNPYIAPAENTDKFNPARLILRPNVPAVKRIEAEARRSLAGYYAAIERIDWNLGRLLGALRELEIDQDTYVVFFSDHGDMLGSQGYFRKTVPWEESLRIPFIIGGGGIEAKNATPRELDHVLNHVDIAPTTLGLCGIGKPAAMDGFDYSAAALGTDPLVDAPDSAYISFPIPAERDYNVDRPYRAIVTRDGWKYAAFQGEPWLLYNLNEDPYEQANLAFQRLFKPKKDELHARLRQWIDRTGDSFSLPDCP